MFLWACSSPGQLRVSDNKALYKEWNKLGLGGRYHVGLSIYDLRKKKSVFNYKADNYFTPASNTKILTMYAALEILDEQLDAALYVEKGDSVVIWGGGDPGTSFPDITAPSALTTFIRSTDKRVVFADQHFRTTRFGKGWAWDDYPYTFQCERNAFPIYGNRLWITRSGDSVRVTPSYLSPIVRVKKDSISIAGKTEWGDGYFYRYNPGQKSAQRQVPITFFRNDVQYSWSEATGKEIHFSELQLSPDAIPIKGSDRDSLIKFMMQDSENFIAEQLLLACSLKELHYMTETDIIDSLLQGPLGDLPDDIVWVDGSGLSRYNLMTPRSLIAVLLHMLELKDLNYIRKIFPAGGQSGTLINEYKGKNGRPYLFAKTGTLRNTYCLSGFLMTKSGNVLLFSWMNNQFPGDASDIKKAMEKLFSFLYDQY
jgi:serine-type D-Ala-D-Ala carboxypeptidase/endopeptidase (penicillin-binding protein 4)